jgi:penicillin-binding protein 2
MKIWRILILTIFLITACTNSNSTPRPTEKPSDGLPTPIVKTTSVPDAAEAAKVFLEKWTASDYVGMYAMLAPTSKDAITVEDFTKIYQDTAQNLSLKNLSTGILTTLVYPASAKIGYQANFSTTLFGDFQRQMEMNLIVEAGEWKVQWEDGLILPEMSGGNRLALNLVHPARGDIYDKDGLTLVTQSEAVALGIWPGQISNSQESLLLSQLSEMTGKPRNMISDLYQYAGADWYIPVGEVSKQGYDERSGTLDTLSGLVTNVYTSRYYFNGGAAPQVLGYMLSISPEQYDEYRRNGYAGDEKIGAAGLEKWGEQYLAGKPAADLYVVKPDGTYSTRLLNADPQAPQSITTTIDKNFQLLVQKALLGFTGAIVVMERDTGRILAMASSPDFDPNVFQTDNYNSQYTLSDLVNDPETPLWNRAAQSGYPLGSVFKLVTAAAALESGLYNPDTTYECTSQFTELPGYTGNDWTFDKGKPPSGTLTLVEGLMRSCNPWFYHLGLDLFRQKGATYLADMARSFGLGSATGIDAVREDVGKINDPVTEGDAVQMGIGQGDMLVTPLQVVDFVAAIGNGGTLYRPQIIEKITNLDGTVVESFSPEVRGTLPISAKTLAALKEGMRMVVREPRGTAYSTFVGMTTPIYGKTGTATTSVKDPHSWFAGFTSAGRADKPDIAVVVLAEYAGEGSQIAAPIFRRVIEAYFLGEVKTYYPWEKTFYLTETPTQEPTASPVP